MEENTSTLDIRAINEKIERESAFIDLLTMEMNKVIVGQKHMVERLLIGLLGIYLKLQKRRVSTTREETTSEWRERLRLTTRTVTLTLLTRSGYFLISITRRVREGL